MIRAITILIFWLFFSLVGPAIARSQAVGTVGGGKPKYRVTTSQFGVVHSQGIHPLRVTVDLMPAKPAVENQKFVANVHTQSQFGTSFKTNGFIEIPSGKSSGSVDLMLPAAGHIQWLNLEVQKFSNPGGGNKSPILYQSLKIDPVDFTQGGQSQTKLLIGKFNTPVFGNSEVIDNRQEFLSNGKNSMGERPLPQPKATNIGLAVSLRKHLGRSDKFASMDVSNLPETWIGLSGFEQILISMGDFESLVTDNEIQRDNFEKWVAACGALVIYSCGADYRETDRILGLFLGKRRAAQITDGELAWSVPANVPTKTDILCAERSFGHAGTERLVRPFKTSLPSRTVENAGFIDSNKFGFLPYLNGCIISVDDDMSRWTREDFRRLDNSVVLNGSSLAARIGNGTGILPVIAIPGVGEPPEMLFKILLTIFLIIAGPVALITFSKIGKPYLLLVLIPLLSIFVSFSLIAFVLISDGFYKTASVHSVTTLDQRTDLAVVNCRAAYFSNFTSTPYSISPDTLFGLTGGWGSRQERIVEQRDGQTLVSGTALMARTLHELSTFKVRSISKNLMFKEGEAANSALPTAQNNLGAKVVFAIFRDANDNFYFVEDLEDGLSKSLVEIQLNGSERVADFARELIDSGRRKKDFSANRYNLYYPVQESELGFGDVEVVLQSAKLSTLLSRPNSYVAFLEDLPLVTDELERVNYKKQNHVILGRW